MERHVSMATEMERERQRERQTDIQRDKERYICVLRVELNIFKILSERLGLVR